MVDEEEVYRMIRRVLLGFCITDKKMQKPDANLQQIILDTVVRSMIGGIYFVWNCRIYWQTASIAYLAGRTG